MKNIVIVVLSVIVNFFWVCYLSELAESDPWEYYMVLAVASVFSFFVLYIWDEVAKMGTKMEFVGSIVIKILCSPAISIIGMFVIIPLFIGLVSKEF